MKRILVFSILTALIGVSAYQAYQFFFPSDRELIMELLDEVEAKSRLDGSENAIQLASQIRSLSSLFAESFVIELDNSYHKKISIESRDSLQSRLLQLSQFVKKFEISFEDTSLELLSDESAKASLTLLATAMRKKTQEDIREASECLIEFHKNTDGDWKLKKIQNIQAVKL